MKASRAHKNVVREYSYRGNFAVLFVDYRLAPKYKFPIPLQDCYEAYLWAARKYKKQRIYLGGDSAGGNLALAVIRKALEKNERIPDKLLLVYPVVDTRMITDSMKESILQSSLRTIMCLCSLKKQRARFTDMMWRKSQNMYVVL